jgi:hypothetical protein
MPFNLPGTLVPFHLIISPRLVIPSMVVKGQSLLYMLCISTSRI